MRGDWDSEIRSKRYPDTFSNNKGHFKAGNISRRIPVYIKEYKVSDDTKKRDAIVKIIQEEVNKGENIDKVIENIASKKYIQKIFNRYVRNGIDLKKVFKNWYGDGKGNRDRYEGMSRE